MSEARYGEESVEEEVARATQTQYLDIARRLLTRFAAANDIEDWSLRVFEVAPWFEAEAERRRWAKKTLWLYKAALIWFMRLHGPIEATDALRRVSARGNPSRGSRTSSLKNKSLPAKDMDVLNAHLESSGHRMDRLLAAWLRAARVTGLRPGEWAAAELRGNVLMVKNAKVNKVRGHGELRTLVFSEEEKTASIPLDEVRGFLKNLHALLEEGLTFQEVYKKCRERMRIACKKLWPRRKRRPTLYSARHQFVADLKARGMSLETVAALMGHATNETASAHYGRKAKGEGGVVLPLARREEVERVRRTFRGKPPIIPAGRAENREKPEKDD